MNHVLRTYDVASISAHGRESHILDGRSHQLRFSTNVQRDHLELLEVDQGGDEEGKSGGATAVVGSFEFATFSRPMSVSMVPPPMSTSEDAKSSYDDYGDGNSNRSIAGSSTGFKSELKRPSFFSWSPEYVFSVPTPGPQASRTFGWKKARHMSDVAGHDKIRNCWVLSEPATGATLAVFAPSDDKGEKGALLILKELQLQLHGQADDGDGDGLVLLTTLGLLEKERRQRQSSRRAAASAGSTAGISTGASGAGVGGP
jgi:hypothetical protein